MPTYSNDNLEARFLDDLPGMSVSLLLTNEFTFHVKLFSNESVELFALLSPKFHIQLTISDGAVEFRRNQYVARKKIGNIRRHYQVLVSWKPDQIQLALIVDDEVGGEEACVSIDTVPFWVPAQLLQQARLLNLLPRKTYSTSAEFLGVFLESLRLASQTIRDTNGYKLYWDRQRSGNGTTKLTPKREPESMKGIVGLLQDQSLLAGYQLQVESQVGPGSLDLQATASLASGGFAKVCLEAKNAHSPDLEHGVSDQLPSYIRSARADYGVYLVLWYKCKEFPEPAAEGADITWDLTKIRPWENIVIERFDLAIPVSPSSKNFKYV